MADGVIVGSALIKAVDNAAEGEKTTAASTFVQGCAKRCKRNNRKPANHEPQRLAT
jgi:tryptophan synthase alpha subunit